MEVKVEQGEKGARGKKTGFYVFFLKQISCQMSDVRCQETAPS
jgi:hypothetical protein